MGVSAIDEESRRRWEPLDVEAGAVASSLAVMAPALTEGGPQKPENLLTPLPSSGFLSPSQASQVCQNRQVLAKFVVSANVQPSKIDDQCLRGISKELIRDVINSRYANGLDTLSAFKKKSSNLIGRKDLGETDIEVELESERPVVLDSLDQKVTDIIMNDPSMGDQQDNMGFLKSNIDVPLAANESLTISSEKNIDVDDQIMNFSGVMPSENEQCSSSGVGDIGQNVEEILQVIKSMEGAENAANIAGGSNEPAPSGADSVEMFPIPEGFSSFERDLLNDVDVMSLCTDNINIDAVEQQKCDNLRNQQDAVTQKQFESERRCAFLLRRLRKLQARLIGHHVAEENTGVLELAHLGVKKYFIQELVNISSKSSVRNFPEISSSLNSFLQKLEKTSVAQSNGVNRQRLCCRYFGGGSRDNIGPPPSTNANRHPVFCTPQVKIQRNDVESVAGPLASQLHTVEDNLDSDCTASSSGGESCDEMQTFNNPHQQPLPISKRAAWRYAQDRAGVASRWTWLQAQISDLEYRIRQHNDLQRHIRATKGLVILESTETVNGYSGVLPGSTGRCAATPEVEPVASRTRPFAWNVYRKRKLLQVDRLHEVSKRAAKASTVRCGCDHVLPACALCTGRQDPTQPQEPFEQLSVQQRVALIDPGFHPVLSFSDEILHGTHLEAIMKSVEWQQKMLRGNMRTTRLKDKEHNERRSKKLPEHRAKYTARLKKSSSSILTARIKRKMLKGKRNRLSHDRSLHGITKKKVTKLPPAEDEDDVGPHSGSSKHSSPVPSPLQHTPTVEKNPPKEKSSNIHGRLRQNSYDIDNIVIPYSVAAATRLEKLQYKEILTPKWRLCEDPTKIEVKNGIMHRPSQESDVEDVTDETIALRHERSEREENKRFMTYVNMPPQARLRHNRRADSRADSGANTPDPMSPQPSEFGGDVVSPITSPPATPLNLQDGENQQFLDANRPSALQNSFRRRTISASRPSRDETGSFLPEDDNEVIPYEPRTFPLSEDTYDKMIEAMPVGHWQASSASLCSRDDEKAEEEAELETPESDSTESACCDVEGEDPNDPEWTVADDRDTEKERIRPTAKR